MKRNFFSLSFISIAILLFLGVTGVNYAEESYQARYAKKVKQNNDTIGVIAGVINQICPKLLAQGHQSLCNAKDPVGTAVGIQKLVGDPDDLEDLEDEEIAKLFTHVGAALQFYDAVEQFKEHYPYRAEAKKLAEANKWKDAFLNEEMAWQYLVKTATNGINANKRLQ